jgi:hypothetical protein
VISLLVLEASVISLVSLEAEKPHQQKAFSSKDQTEKKALLSPQH